MRSGCQCFADTRDNRPFLTGKDVTMLNLREYRRCDQRLSNHLAWVALIAPDVMLNKDGSFMATVRFRGTDVDSGTPEQLMAFRARLNNTLRRFGSGWCLHVESVRRRSATPIVGTLINAVSDRIETERRLALAATPAYESDQYITFTYLPPADRIRRVRGWLMGDAWRSSDRGPGYYQEQLDLFRRQVDQTIDLLDSFMPDVQRLTDGEWLSYLHDSVSERTVSVTPISTATSLFDMPSAASRVILARSLCRTEILRPCDQP